jgi:hypothetical protein
MTIKTKLVRDTPSLRLMKGDIIELRPLEPSKPQGGGFYDVADATHFVWTYEYEVVE